MSSVNKEIRPPSRADTVVATRQIEQGKDTESDVGEEPQNAPGEGTWGRVGAARMGGPAGEEGRQEDAGPAGALGPGEAAEALREKSRSSSCCDGCGPSRGVQSSSSGRRGAEAGPSEKAMATGVILGLRRAWPRALGEGGRGSAGFGSGLTGKWDGKCRLERALRI